MRVDDLVGPRYLPDLTCVLDPPPASIHHLSKTRVWQLLLSTS